MKDKRLTIRYSLEEEKQLEDLYNHYNKRDYYKIHGEYPTSEKQFLYSRSDVYRMLIKQCFDNDLKVK